MVKNHNIYKFNQNIYIYILHYIVNNNTNNRCVKNIRGGN